MSRVHVTGGNGFMGSRIVRSLIRHGHDVVALVGADLDTVNLEGVDVETRPLDLLDPTSALEALEGGECLIHNAACYSFWEPDRDRIYEVNVGGTRAVLDAAARLGYGRVVYTSTAGTLMPSLNRRVADEESLFDPRRFQGHYKTSKLMAEMEALRHFARGLDGVIVHPTVVIGEGDRRPTPTGMIVVHFLNGLMKAYASTLLDVVDVEDVAEGHVLALERGRSGHQYVLGGETLTMREVTGLLSELTGLPAPRFELPPRVLRAIGRANEWIADHVTHRRPVADVEAALHAESCLPASSEKAVKELGYRARPARVTLARAVRWFVESGVCDDARARRIREHGVIDAVLAAEEAH